jgi:hypothetical protein
VAGRHTRLRNGADRVPGPCLIVPPLVVASGLPWPEARALIEESVAIYESLDDEAGAALATATMGLAAFFHGELDTARRCLEQALAEHAELAHPLFHSRARIYLGATLSFMPHRREDGRLRLHEGLERARRIGDGWGAGVALTLLGLAALRSRARDRAREHLRAALHLDLQAGVSATAVGGLGQVALDDDARRASSSRPARRRSVASLGLSQSAAASTRARSPPKP